MNRMLKVTAVYLGANAIGLLIAAMLFDKFEITGLGFVVALATFTVVEVVADAVVDKAKAERGGLIRGGMALISTYVGLLMADLVSDSLDIEGLGTWVMATLVVFVVALIATFVLAKLLVGRDRG